MSTSIPSSIFTMFEQFSSEQACRTYLQQVLWPNGPICPFCSHDKVYHFRNGYTFKCASCRKNFGVTKGTIFEGTKIPLRKWFFAIYLFGSHKKGVSSHQMARDLKITQPNAWHMLHKIREMMHNNTAFRRKLCGVVEIDETYVGGKNKNRHYKKRKKGIQGRSTKDKAVVWGLMERGGSVAIIPIKRLRRKAMQLLVKNKVAAGSRIMTDEYGAYSGLNRYFDHGIVNHGAHEYCKEDVTTNSIEGFWSWLKRSITGIYHRVSRRRLFAYCYEMAFRYNTRKENDGERFSLLLSQCVVR